MTTIDATYLADVEDSAKHSIEHHETSEMFPAMGPRSILDARKVLEWVEHTRHLKDTALELVSDKLKLQKQLKETQYLSTLWIQALTEFIPAEKRNDALAAAARLIIKGMKEAGIEEYVNESSTQLET